MVIDQREDQYAAGDAERKSGDIDRGKNLIAFYIAPCNLEIIFYHRLYFLNEPGYKLRIPEKVT